MLRLHPTVHEQGCQVKGAQLTFLGRGRATPPISRARQATEVRTRKSLGDDVAAVLNWRALASIGFTAERLIR